MKTAISLSDEVFAGAERLAKRERKSRSQLYAEALAEYIARHGDDEITSAMDRALDAIDEPADPAIAAAARHTLEKIEW
jgi:predicted transcriptional regulator